LIVIPNEKLLATAKDAGFFESFRIADDILRQAVQGISDIITIPGVINRDFADVKTTMAGMGYSVMGTAVRSGPGRAREAALAAMASPLLEDGAIDGARGILINISGSSSLKLNEVIEASSLIQEAAHEDANIIFGAVLDENMGDEVKFTVIATGFRNEAMPARRERMMAGTGLPTAQVSRTQEYTPPRIVSRPVVARFASEPDDLVMEAEPVLFASEEAMPAIRLQGEPEIEEPVEEAIAEPVVEPAAEQVEVPEEQVVEARREPVEEPAVVPAPVVEAAPVQRPAYPVSSYYETARQQAWHEPPPRIEFVPSAPAEVQETRVQEEPAVEAAKVEAAPEMPRGPVVVERIGEHIVGAHPESAIEVSETAEGYAPIDLHSDAAAKETSPELVPVRASVFDDDFFRRPNEEDLVKTGQEPEQKLWPNARVPSFAGYASDGAENDELDIPAFLRRKP